MKFTTERIGDSVILTVVDRGPDGRELVVLIPMSVKTTREVAELLNLTAAGYGGDALDAALNQILDGT